MRRLVRFKPSPAMVVACVALFVALQGAGNAATGAAVGIHKSLLVTAQAGQTRPIMSMGPFRFALQCKAAGGSDVDAAVTVRTVQDHVAFESNFSVRKSNFMVSDGPIQITDPTTSADPTKRFDGPGGAFAAISRDGFTYMGDGFVGASFRGHQCVGGVIAIY